MTRKRRGVSFQAKKFSVIGSFSLRLTLFALAAGSVCYADANPTPWGAFHVGDRVELDSACTGNWRRVTITKMDTDPYSAKATKYTIQREDGTDWTFSGPGIVAPCMRPMSSAAATAVTVPSGPTQPLQGLYLQLQPSGTAYAYVHYYFWKDGRVCQGLPHGGLDGEPADFAAIQRIEKCGQYRIAGDRMNVRWQGDAAAHDETLRHFRPSDFEMNGYTTAKVASFSRGQHLNGTFSATVVGKQISKQNYMFHADGSYRFTSNPVTSRDGAARNERGTYRISGNVLELSGTGGAKRMTVYPFGNKGLMIEGTVFSE